MFSARAQLKSSAFSSFLRLQPLPVCLQHISLHHLMSSRLDCKSKRGKASSHIPLYATVQRQFGSKRDSRPSLKVALLVFSAPHPSSVSLWLDMSCSTMHSHCMERMMC